jgi:hypothetical protein
MREMSSHAYDFHKHMPLTKLLKSTVRFEHPAKGARHCGQCKYFQAKVGRCEIVVGVIEAQDWCEHWEAK